MYISKGNKKTGKVLIWSLPAKKTCPGSTEMCRKNCYAKKAEKQFPPVLPCRELNLESTKWDSFEAQMILRIAKMTQRREYLFRIHESGDFYNQDYLDKWKRIAAALPNIKFLAFTKSYHLDFSDTPENLRIVVSVFPDSPTIPKSIEHLPRAYAGNCELIEKTMECYGECETCGLCWELKDINRNVHFDLH